MSTTDTFPNLDGPALHAIDDEQLLAGPGEAPPRILLLYGSLRTRSFSRLAAEEAARILRRLGAETRFFDPAGLPLPDDADADHPRVKALRELATWCDGFVKFTRLTRGCREYLVDRYSERVESTEALSARVNQRSI